MKVTVESFDVAAEVKTKGIEVAVDSPDGPTQYGDLVLTKRKLVRCKERMKPANGVEIKREDFIAWAQSR